MTQNAKNRYDAAFGCLLGGIIGHKPSRWLEEAKNNVDVPYSPHMGFIKIGLTHAFSLHLLQQIPYLPQSHRQHR